MEPHLGGESKAQDLAQWQVALAITTLCGDQEPHTGKLCPHMVATLQTEKKLEKFIPTKVTLSKMAREDTHRAP
jgi:hypothetical protein